MFFMDQTYLCDDCLYDDGLYVFYVCDDSLCAYDGDLDMKWYTMYM